MKCAKIIQTLSKHHIPIGGILNFSFMENKDGIPRHPVYRGIRTDVVF